ncbi:MAG: acyl-CoA dehydrogenase [Sulfitobacter sp.]|uniref:acyl-CoA dehydrogenase n=1 Tax=unclassified Sulfitobacter TaxID=196795 RepID=UPI002942E493|nr:acyl-CoA dehydrogenase [Sulfitobacter sp. LC.270.F.C4]WOI13799.1 acyl-CoA dehydrogenase [Sulfitobacter sp. LC.270.F.C4]
MNSAPRFDPFPPSSQPDVLSQAARSALRKAAPDEEAGTAPISASIEILRDAGLMLEDGAASPLRTAHALMQIGAANLSVGRLWEGHVNALRLIRLYGSPAQAEHAKQVIKDGGLLGVWGADGGTPAKAEGSVLQGEKIFASGLGTVTHALISLNSGPEVQLALIDVTDPRRGDATQWDMLGMQATASGTYNFSGLPLGEEARIGAPGDYLKEPHFIGGVWRIAALQAGAAAGLIDAAASALRDMDRLEAEAQLARLMQVLMRVWAGMALVERAGQASVGDHEEETIVSTSIAARLYTEEVALDTIKAVEQSLGLRHFTASSETGRMARDLSVYLRQAARDAFLQRAAGHALSSEKATWGVFG